LAKTHSTLYATHTYTSHMYIFTCKLKFQAVAASL